MFGAIVAAVTLAACGFGPIAPENPDRDRLLAQAQAALDRWAAVAAAGDPDLVPVGELTGQIGTWEEKVGDNNKAALFAGLVDGDEALSDDPPPDGVVEWANGTVETVALMSAADTLASLRDAGTSECSDCDVMHITSARLVQGVIETTRGPAHVPTWAFSVEFSAVEITRVAVLGVRDFVPPEWDPNNPPVGISIAGATGTVGGRELVVTFIGAPGTGDEPCGADYGGEAVESDRAVVVVVHVVRGGEPANCVAVGAQRTASVQLADVLGDRAILEVREGRPVPVVLGQ